MKKSFLKRVAAAVVAVPVALTQTALFTSVAVEETKATATASDASITLADLMKIDPNSKLIAAEDFESVVGTRFSEGLAESLSAYVQVSDWGTKLENGLGAFENEYKLDKAGILKALENKSGAKFDLVKNAIADKNTTVTADITDGMIFITFDINYAYGQDLCDMANRAMNRKIATRYDDCTVNAVPVALADNRVNAIVTLAADTSKIADKNVKFGVKVNGFDGESRDVNPTTYEGVKAVEAWFLKEAKNAALEMKQDAERAVDVVNAETPGKLNKDEIVSSVDRLMNTIDKYETKFDSKQAKRIYRTAAPVDSFDEVLAAIDKDFRRAPASVDSVENHKFFDNAKAVFDNAIEQINQQADNGSKIDITTDDVMNLVKGAHGINAFAMADASVYTAEGETLFYVEDDLDAAGEAIIKANINNTKEMQARNKEVDVLFTLKVVEAKGSLNATSAFDGEGALDFYRFVMFTEKDKGVEPTTAESTSTETTATTQTSVSTETSTTVETTQPTDPAESTESSKSTETTQASSSTESTTTTTVTSTESSTTDSTTTSASTTTETTASSETTNTETTKHTAVAGQIVMDVNVKTEAAAGAGFYYANDKAAIEAEDLAVLPNESPEMEGKVDVTKFTVGDAKANVTPEALFAANEADGYVVKAINLYYNGLQVVDKDRNAVTATVYVGVKGDLNQDKACNANDATRALIHAAQVGTTKAGDPLPTIKALGGITMPAAADEATFDKFLIFLGDTDTESAEGEKIADKIVVNAADATNMLKYAALVGTNPVAGEAGHKTVVEMWNIVQGADGQTAYDKAILQAETASKA